MTAPRDAIQAETERRAWQLVDIAEDVASGKTTNGRHGLRAAMDRIEAGEADALVVAKLDRLSRSLLDFAAIMERAQRKHREIVVLDQGFDMTTSNGRAMAGMLAVFAQWERELIGERTRKAIAAKRAAGTLKATIGRAGWTTRPPMLIPDDVRRRIMRLHKRGVSRNAIARQLNEEGVPTAAGGKRWYDSTVRRVLESAGRQQATLEDAARRADVVIRDVFLRSSRRAGRVRRSGDDHVLIPVGCPYRVAVAAASMPTNGPRSGQSG